MGIPELPPIKLSRSPLGSSAPLPLVSLLHPYSSFSTTTLRAGAASHHWLQQARWASVTKSINVGLAAAACMSKALRIIDGGAGLSLVDAAI